MQKKYGIEVIVEVVSGVIVVEVAVAVAVAASMALVVSVGLEFAERSVMLSRIGCALLLYNCSKRSAMSLHKEEIV